MVINEKDTYSKSFPAAGCRSKDVIRVASAQDQGRAIPLSLAAPTVQIHAPALQATHAHGAQILKPSIRHHSLQKKGRQKSVTLVKLFIIMILAPLIKVPR